MKEIARKFAILLLGLHVTTLLFPALTIRFGWEGYTVAVAIYAFLYLFIRPILKIIFFPIHLLTLSVSLWIIDIILFVIWLFVAPGVKLTAADFPSFTLGPISVGAIHLVYWQSLIVAGILLRAVIKLIQWMIE